MAGTIAKPLLRGQLNRNIAKNFMIAVGFSTVSCILFKLGYADPKKQKYADFYKTYDAEADFERMRNLGLFQSVRPEGK